MRRLLTVAALGALLGAWPAGASPPSDKFLVKTAGDLVEICTVAETDALYPSAIAFCHGYVLGAYHYHNALYSHGKKKPKPMFCLPEPPPTRAKAIDQYIAWLQDNPKYAQEPAVETIFEYLMETYPCPK